MHQTSPNLEELRIDRTVKRGRGAGLWVLGLLVLLLAAFALLAWKFWPTKVVTVRTATAREAASGPAERTVLNASGYVVARREATVSSKVTGKVVEVLVEEGMRVQQGQVLARLDDVNVMAALRLAEARLVSATNALNETRVRIREAARELNRQKNLLTNNIATAADYDRAEAAALAYEARLEQQQAEVMVAQREVASFEQQLEDTVIRAPFAGIVTSKNAQPGEMISPVSAGGGFTRTGICTIVDMDSLEIEVDVNEGYINRVEPGQPVEAALDAYPGWKIPCKVIAIIPTADRQKSTVRVRVAFDSLDKRILPQMSIKVAFRGTSGIETASHRNVTLPKKAVQTMDGREVVFVIQKNTAERRAVTVASSNGTDVVLSGGVTTGEKVAVEWSKPLADGMPVKEIN